MILAVMDYVDDKGPPPPVLSMALDCRRWRTLPEGGNWRNQYAREMNQMDACLNVFDTWRDYGDAQRDNRGGEFLERNPEANKLVGRVLRLDMERSNG